MAVRLYAPNRQWFDLGIHTDACMTTMTCGAAGGAVSLWVNLYESCGQSNGVITTWEGGFVSGFSVECST